MNIKKVLPLACITSSLLVTSLSAAKLFEATVTPELTAPISRSNSSFIDLNKEIFGTKNELVVLDNQSYLAQFTYYGIPNAMTVNSNATGTVVTLKSDLTGLNRTFTGPTRGNVKDQIEDFFLNEGGGELKKLDKEVSKRSAASITDGNPMAATALLADSIFGSGAFGKTSTEKSGKEADATRSKLYFGIGSGLSFSAFQVDTPNGNSLDGIALSVPVELMLGTKRVNVKLDAPLNYTEIEGTAIYGGGLNASLNYRPFMFDADSDWEWKLSPTFGAMGRGSLDGANASILFHYGLSNQIAYRIGGSTFISLGSQLTQFGNLGFEMFGIDFAKDIDQNILKNGLKVSHYFGSFNLVGFIIDSRFLEDAAVDSYQTLGTEVIWNVTDLFSLNLGFKQDISNIFMSSSVYFTGGWSF
jgi:hypothetical protein